MKDEKLNKLLISSAFLVPFNYKIMKAGFVYIQRMACCNIHMAMASEAAMSETLFTEGMF